MITRQEIESTYDLVRSLYEADDIPWVLGYSGGKDSTATLQLVWLALEGMPEMIRNRKPIYVISTDTLVESPVIARWVERSLDLIREQADAQKMPFITHRLTPKVTDTFWVNLLGRGYPYPRATMRWCTDRLKISPSNTFIKSVVSAYGEAILLLGTRKAESAHRAQNMERYEKMRVREYLSPNGSMRNSLVFSPLEKWTSDDVWFFLLQYENPWGYSNKDLLNLYRGATEAAECPIITDLSTPSCGKSRFGCWVCTLVEKDKSMEAMIVNDSQKAWMLPLLDFRNEIGDSERDWERRDFRKMHGNLFLQKDHLIHGPYRREIREEWLRKLLRVQKEINENGLEECRDMKLITVDELNKIRQIWLEEKHEFCDSLPDIYREETGEELPLEYCGRIPYGKEEWDLLKQVCSQEEESGEEQLSFELAYRLIDVESRFSSLQKRKGIYTRLGEEIRRCIYSNEADALDYALKRQRRRAEYGEEEWALQDGNISDAREEWDVSAERDAE